MHRPKKTALLAATLIAGAAVAAMAQSPHGGGAPAPTPAADEPAGEGPAADDGAALDPAVAAVMDDGEAVYMSTCVSCHGVAGEGPAAVLAGEDALEDVGVIAGQVIYGGHFMPAFPQLSDEQIAAVGTYIRNSWGNAFGPMTVEDVANFR